MKKAKLFSYARVINFAFSFGTTAIIAMLVGFWGGSWVDTKLATSPLFMILGLMLGIAITFQALFSELKVYNKLEEIAAKQEQENDNDEGKS